MKYTTMPDGSLVFPHRGDPPREFNNYKRDPKDPYVLIPSFIPCRHRVLETRKSKCNKISCVWRCSLKGILVIPSICDSCEVEPKGE